jgi:hypothetical protein
MEETLRQSRKGLNALKARVMLKGMTVVDKRSAAARALLEWRAELVDALGGEEGISPQRMALIEMATRTRLLVEHCDSYLMVQKTLINRRKKGVYPIVRDRTALVEALARLLKELGLNRVERPVPSLQEYLAARTPEPEATIEQVEEKVDE